MAVPRVWAVIVAAGWGERFGGPKQFAELGGARLVDHAVATAAATCDAVVLVVPDASDWRGADVDALVTGGASRAESVRAGLGAVSFGAEIVVVHDAARPLATAALFTAVVDAVRNGADGAVPGLAVTDTLKRVDDVRVTSTVDRVGLVAVQTPQAFRADILRDAHANGADATDDAALVEELGGSVVVVPGDPRNLKVTGPADLMIAAALLETS
ncbi:MAG TPA: 2-C-methyl-D-erythritol 4-phosphate cytidylyltransferase [Acidimicrobiia bacterium]|jgi:2-C-methyl-D-erythritol 4-phosphate cytidylyltransferase